MKSWQIVILTCIVAAFAGIITAQLSTNEWVDFGVCGLISLLAGLLIRAGHQKK